ncbi:hypothetical protein Q6348_02360 [Isoptericola sp. b441]|uniref:Uncharacterized protein n=1 Tax=Actinotalea lenta TaxID=3064654 RepID=A0ABT9D5G7_9CELL|nr:MULTISPECIES: hypothetical protein [unclassified Isoptericola]MDO8106035.1 hypothetical protein [Isoptericola sp. b441]MDO8122246.1 hypothetical protein [Isoptericola sp. b490]
MSALDIASVRLAVPPGAVLWGPAELPAAVQVGVPLPRRAERRFRRSVARLHRRAAGLEGLVAVVAHPYPRTGRVLVSGHVRLVDLSDAESPSPSEYATEREHAQPPRRVEELARSVELDQLGPGQGVLEVSIRRRPWTGVIDNLFSWAVFPTGAAIAALVELHTTDGACCQLATEDAFTLADSLQLVHEDAR